MSAKKGQKFKHYPESLKVEAIRLHVDEGWGYSKITTHLDVHDKNRVKVWMKKYREKGHLVPKSACHAEAIVMTTPQWRASSLILKSKHSIYMIYDRSMRHKDELRNISAFTTKIGRNEN